MYWFATVEENITSLITTDAEIFVNAVPDCLFPSASPTDAVAKESSLTPEVMPELLSVIVPELLPDGTETALIVAVAPLKMNDAGASDQETLSENVA